MIEHGLNMTTVLINIPKITHLSQQGLSCAVNVLLTWEIQENIPSRSGGSYSKLLLNRLASRATWCSPFNKLGMSPHGHIDTAETFSWMYVTEQNNRHFRLNGIIYNGYIMAIHLVAFKKRVRIRKSGSSKMLTFTKIVSFSVWVRYFVWCFKGTLWNSTLISYPYIERCVVF